MVKNGFQYEIKNCSTRVVFGVRFGETGWMHITLLVLSLHLSAERTGPSYG